MSIRSAAMAALAACLMFAAAGPPAAARSIAAPPAAVAAPTNYLQTIRYIDDGMKYLDPLSGFFVSPGGELCFRSLPSTPQSIYDQFYSNWCMQAYAVGRVEESRIGLLLWCAHAYPHCAHRMDYPRLLATKPWIANSIIVEAIPHRQERTALEHLISLLGGRLQTAGR